MEDVSYNKAKKILNTQVEIIKSKDEIIDILKRENKALKEELEKKTV